MTPQQMFEELRRQGYAVTMFTPDELGNADPGKVEDIMCERGFDAIVDLQ